MTSWLADMVGEANVPAVLWTLGLLVVVAALLAVASLSRRLRFPFAARGRGRHRRLTLVDAVALDGQRRLVLVRRDEAEHLILIGGANDLIVERDLARPPAQEPRQPDALPRSPVAAARPAARGRWSPQRLRKPAAAGPAEPAGGVPDAPRPPAPAQRTEVRRPEPSGAQPRHEAAAAGGTSEGGADPAGEARADGPLLDRTGTPLPKGAAETDRQAISARREPEGSSMEEEMSRLLEELSGHDRRVER